MVFGASVKVEGASMKQLCQPLLHAALEDCQSVGEQPQALAALYGLCDYVKACLEGEQYSAALDGIDEKELEAVTAIATGIPRPGHTVVGKGTHEDAALVWEEVAKEYTKFAEECQLYGARCEFVGIELLADTQPAYLASAGGAMARYFFIE